MLIYHKTTEAEKYLITAWEYSRKLLYLEVRTWNTRAARCYQKAGFRIIGEPICQVTSLGEGFFYHMRVE